MFIYRVDDPTAMTALQSIRPAAGGIVRNPILVVITALFGLSQLPNLFIQKTKADSPPHCGRGGSRHSLYHTSLLVDGIPTVW